MREEPETPASGSADEQLAADERRRSSESQHLATPKRGAFPTPKSEIESATPYTPENAQAGGGPSAQAEGEPTAEPVSPATEDQEEQ
jgi:hypothetical protein